MKTKQKIIKLLKASGGLTTAELGEMLRISATAVRRHLSTLEKQDLVRYNTDQRGMGRPSYVYRLTAHAPHVFDQSYAAFAASTIQELIELDAETEPDEVFDPRQKKRRQQYIARTTGETLTDRVASLARLMESEGRIATWQKLNENRFILREHNCAWRRLTEKLDYPCRCEINLLKETLKAKVERVNHILDGDVSCAYEIVGPADEIPREAPIIRESSLESTFSFV
jgi:predicted ArsR family transcriptional regulator